MRKLVTMLVVLLFVLTACGGSETTESVTLDGTWTDAVDEDITFVATITNDLIKITIDDDESSSLYWKGTFSEFGETVSEGMQITSNADEEALAASFMGSASKTKTFVYKDGTLDFDFSALGTTREIHLKKE